MFGNDRRWVKLELDQMLKHRPDTTLAALENRCTLARTVGSNPTPSASQPACSGSDLRPWAGLLADLSRPKARTSEVTWLPFTIAELNKLFTGAAFEVNPDKHTMATARPWVMAVALFSGMRQGEVCELEAENVKRQDGAWFFDVTAAKSEAGVRRVPVHPELIGLGFLDYVKAIGSGFLFPGITPGGPDRKRGHTMAKRFPEYRRNRRVERARTVFHSFRKCFIRANGHDQG